MGGADTAQPANISVSEAAIATRMLREVGNIFIDFSLIDGGLIFRVPFGLSRVGGYR